MSRAGDRHRAKKRRCLALKRWRERPIRGVSQFLKAYLAFRSLSVAIKRLEYFRALGEFERLGLFTDVIARIRASQSGE